MTKLTEGKVLHQDKSKLNIPKPSGPPPPTILSKFDISDATEDLVIVRKSQIELLGEMANTCTEYLTDRKCPNCRCRNSEE